MFEGQRAAGGLLPPETELMTVQPGVIGPGSFLIQSWVVRGLPKSLLLETQIFGHWRLVVNLNAREIEDQLAEAGWHCCAMAPAIEASAFGCDDDVVNRVLNRLVELTSGDSNAIEITGISTMQFLGLDYVSVSALARHVEKEPVSRASLCLARASRNDFPTRYKREQ